MTGGKLALALAAAAMVMTPAIGLAAAGQQRPPAISLSFDNISTFTPASADPRLAAMFANRGPQISDFKFTPAAAKGRPSQLRLALRGRGKRLAVAADVARAADPDPAIGSRETAVIGVSYNLKRFTGRIAVGGER